MKDWISANKKWFFPLFALAAILLVTGVYFLGQFLLPGVARLYYENKNCPAVVSTGNFFSSLYQPDQLVSDLVEECAGFVAAQALEQNQAWQDAYLGYEAYLKQYPNGVVALEAAWQAAAARYQYAQYLAQQGQYEEATAEILALMRHYPSSTEFVLAQELFADVHIRWGGELLAEGDYPGAEEVFLTLKEWADQQGGIIYPGVASDELVGFYYQQAKMYQDDGKFELAVEKFQQAIQVDEFSPIGVRAKESFVEYLLAEGGQLVKTGEYEGAIEIYLLGVSEYPSESQDRLREQIIQSYADWAVALAEDGRFALAQETLANINQDLLIGDLEQVVESARDGIYGQLADSTGEEATALMQEVVRAKCEQKPVDITPIFGVNDGTAQFAFYGLGDRVAPTELIAQAPRDLRYVVCIESGQKILESVTIELRPYKVWGQILEDLVRNQTITATHYYWDVKLYDLTTGFLVATTKIDGSFPEKIPVYFYRNRIILYRYGLSRDTQRVPLPSSTFGSPPSIEDLLNWLNTQTGGN